MYRNTLIVVSVVVLLVSFAGNTCCAQSPQLKMTTDIPKSITAPDTVETSLGTFECFDGVPKEGTVTKPYDFIDRGRAVEAFLNYIPAMSVYQIELVE